MPDDDLSPLNATQAIEALSNVVLSDGSFEDVLQRATMIIKRAVSGADEVSVTMQNGRPVTVAASGVLALEVDESQYQAGYGPCLDAIRLGQTILVTDQASESRWPAYSPRAVEAGVASSVSVPLPVDGAPVGAFNIYSRAADAFGTEAVNAIENFAAYAAVVLNNAGLYFSASARAEQMADAMQSRAVIEQAKGILMGTRHCDADEAFQALVRLSQQTQRKLHLVAQTLVADTVAGG